MDTSERRDFTEFVAARGQALLRVAYALTGEQHAAEDLVQTALAKAMLRWRKIEGDAEPYLRKIMYNEHVSWWRRHWRRAEKLVSEPPEYPSGPDLATEASARLQLRAALDTLPPRQRAVIVLRYLEDLSTEQVADLLGCSPGTVGSQASRALATLRKAMNQSEMKEVLR